jgi:hypothetical protein
MVNNPESMEGLRPTESRRAEPLTVDSPFRRSSIRTAYETGRHGAIGNLHDVKTVPSQYFGVFPYDIVHTMRSEN